MLERKPKSQASQFYLRLWSDFLSIFWIYWSLGYSRNMNQALVSRPLHSLGACFLGLDFPSSILHNSLTSSDLYSSVPFSGRPWLASRPIASLTGICVNKTKVPTPGSCLYVSQMDKKSSCWATASEGTCDTLSSLWLSSLAPAAWSQFCAKKQALFL